MTTANTFEKVVSGDYIIKEGMYYRAIPAVVFLEKHIQIKGDPQ